jgi:hypothetical protein
MTDHEIQLLAIGTALGMYLMLLLQIGFEIHADRRAHKARRADEAKLKAAREKAGA